MCTNVHNFHQHAWQTFLILLNIGLTNPHGRENVTSSNLYTNDIHSNVQSCMPNYMIITKDTPALTYHIIPKDPIEVGQMLAYSQNFAPTRRP